MCGKRKGFAMQRKIVKKICMLGDSGVGKTSLIKRFVFDVFDDQYIETIGTKITKKEVPIKDPSTGEDINMVLMIWDILGHKSPKRVPSSYYVGVEGVMVVCDATRRETYQELDYWVNTLVVMTQYVPIVFLANKGDLINERQVGEKEMEELSAKFNAPYFFTSAKNGLNVEKCFVALAEALAPKEAPAEKWW
jgi:small GTP-binding protein